MRAVADDCDGCDGGAHVHDHGRDSCVGGEAGCDGCDACDVGGDDGCGEGSDGCGGACVDGRGQVQLMFLMVHDVICHKWWLHRWAYPVA